MELFERYIYQVGRRVPKKQRADIENELRASLMQALDDRTTERGGVPNREVTIAEGDLMAVLREFGPPAAVAASYAPHTHYLIGPRLFPIFLINVWVLVGLATVANVLGLALGLQGGWTTLGETLYHYVLNVLASFGLVTLVFALLERVLPQSVWEGAATTAWDPRSMPPVPDAAEQTARSQVKVSRLITEICLWVIMLLVFNLFPEKTFISLLPTADGSWQIVPLFSQAFLKTYLPLLTLGGVGAIILNGVLIYRGRWERGTRLVDFLLAAYGVFVVAYILRGPSVIDVNSAWLNVPQAPELLPLFSQLFKLLLAFVVLLTSANALYKLYLVFRKS